MKVTIKNDFKKEGSFAIIREPIKLHEMQVECALNLRETRAIIPAEAENSDHDDCSC